jgi:hypothetical protein
VHMLPVPRKVLTVATSVYQCRAQASAGAVTSLQRRDRSIGSCFIQIVNGEERRHVTCPRTLDTEPSPFTIALVDLDSEKLRKVGSRAC